MDNTAFIDIIYNIINIKDGFVLSDIIKQIINNTYTNVSNGIILWNNQIVKTQSPIIYKEFYPYQFNTEDYFTENLISLDENITVASGKELYQLYPHLFNSNITTIDSICILSINNTFNKSKAIIILFSYDKKISISDYQLEILTKIIKKSYDKKTSILQNKFYNFIDELSDFTGIKRREMSLSNKYDNISKALEHLSENVMHFSIWKVNDISQSDYRIIKEKNQNFKHTYVKNYRYILSPRDNHRVVNYVNFLKQNQIQNNEIPFKQFIKAELFQNRIYNGSCFTDEYCESINIKENVTIVLYIPIIPPKNVKSNRINILCVYVNHIQYSILRSSTILELLSHKIYESLTLYNQLIINQTTNEILKLSESDNGHKEKGFYKEAAEIFKYKSACNECYIYFRDNSSNEFEVVNDLVDDEFEDNEGYKYPINSRLKKDTAFLSFFNDYFNRKGTNIYYGTPYKDIYSAIIIPCENKLGFVLLINKEVESGIGEHYSPFFSIHDELITALGLESLYRYQLLRSVIKNRELLLKRIRHEIPHEVTLINQNVQIIKEFQDNIKPYYEYRVSKHQENVITQIELSSLRIELYARFATSVGFSKEDILSKMEDLNLNILLSSTIDIFRLEGRKNGISVEFIEPDKSIEIWVSQLYKLAIINIIFNAIRYSLFGTNVLIYFDDKGLYVDNFGIPILQEEHDLIYKEHYRGKHAKTFSQDGMGFGLFLAKKVIEAHNQKLDHYSDLYYQHNYDGIRNFYNILDNKLQYNKMKYYNNLLSNGDIRSESDFNRERNFLENLIPANVLPRQINSDIIAEFIKKKFDKSNIMFDNFIHIFLTKKVYHTRFFIKFK